MCTLSRIRFYPFTAATVLAMFASINGSILTTQTVTAQETLQEGASSATTGESVPQYAQIGNQTEKPQSFEQPEQAETAASLVNFEPFQVFVAHANAFAHCGPSQEYYRTDPLRFGQTLEVYTETNDGWLGIRPPADSFCWLPAETVQMDSGGELGTVIEDRTVSWIGTQLGRARQYRWQVQLAKGEQITVIGRSEREGPDGPQLWLRIVPPSGEYRWVHRDSVVVSTEELVALAQRSQNVPVVGGSVKGQSGTSSQNDEMTLDPVYGQSVLEPSQPIGSGVRSVVGENQLSERVQAESLTEQSGQTAMDVFREEGLLASLEFMTRPKIQDIGAQPQTASSRYATGGRPAWNASPRSTLRANDSNWVSGRSGNWQTPDDSTDRVVAAIQEDGFRASARGIQNDGSVMQVGATSEIDPSLLETRVASLRQQVQGADVDQLNLLLSRLMAVQASWQEIAVVADAATGLATSQADVVVSQRAQMVVETAQRYQRLAARRNQTAVVSAGGSPRASGNAATPMPSEISSRNIRQNPSSLPTRPALPMQGEVVRQEGYLVEVYSARSNSPPYALTDAAGRTVAYLSPVPGVNLRSLLNQQVGVVGSIGSVAGLDTPHLMVTQAIRMDQ